MTYTPPSYAHLPDVVWAPKTSDGGASGAGVAQRETINDVSTSPSETQAQVAAENAPLRIVYGECLIGAQLMDILVYQGKIVIPAVWALGPNESITVYVDDKLPQPGVDVTNYLGAASQAVDATLVGAYAESEIVYGDTLDGIGYSVVSVNQTGDSTGFPSLKAVVRGRKLYDPRNNQTVWSSNPALALADFIESPVYGWNRAVDWSTVSGAADYCDELVGGNPRRRIGLCIDSVNECSKWVEVLRTYAGCWVAQGKDGVQLIPDRRV